MVIPFGAPEVAHLVDHRLKPVVHCLWLLSFVEDESTEPSLDRLVFGDLGHLVPFVRCLEDIPNFFSIFQPLHLIILLSTQGSEEYRSFLGIKMPNLGGLIGVVVLVVYLWCLRSKLKQYPKCFRGARLDGASFYHSTYNNLLHQNMVVFLGVQKVEERAFECEDREEASYYTSYALGVSK
jgi:hypothetical protein